MCRAAGAGFGMGGRVGSWWGPALAWVGVGLGMGGGSRVLVGLALAWVVVVGNWWGLASAMVGCGGLGVFSSHGVMVN